MMHDTTVFIEDLLRADVASGFARSHGLKTTNDISGDGIFLIFKIDRVELLLKDEKNKYNLHVDFTSGTSAHRRQYGGGKGQLIGKAIGLNRGFKPRVLDATAGLGRDAFVMATLGAKVMMSERSPVVHLLLVDALDRAKSCGLNKGDEELVDIVGRMGVLNIDSLNHMANDTLKADVVYLDPMFPERKKSALVKKEMRIFHHLVGDDPDADELLEPAMEHAIYRVVVKRPKIAPYLADAKPSYQLVGKSSRFDIYTKKALPI